MPLRLPDVTNERMHSINILFVWEKRALASASYNPCQVKKGFVFESLPRWQRL